MKLALALFCCLCLALPGLAQTPSDPLDDASAQKLLRSVLQLYENHGQGLLEENPQYPQLVHSSLRQLVQQDTLVQLPGGQMPYTAHLDLFCDCEVFEGIWNLKLGSAIFRDAPLPNQSRAFVTATFQIVPPQSATFDDTRWMKFVLVPEDGRWKIYDMENLLQGSASARRWIQQDLTHNVAKKSKN